jgi:hypothetical protein
LKDIGHIFKSRFFVFFFATLNIIFTFGAEIQKAKDMSAAFTLSTAIKFAEHLALAEGFDIAEDFLCPRARGIF